MNALAQKIIDAHGGLNTWNAFTSLTAHLRQDGALWHLKGHGGKLDETNVTVGLRDEWASHHPFGAEGNVTRFQPGKVEIKDGAGKALEELNAPRAHLPAIRLRRSGQSCSLRISQGLRCGPI